jgi:sodium transport system permease protein
VNLPHIFNIFRKDGLELLRDRRTLFVNVVLPALLYPLITLFMIQVMQLTQAQRLEPPRVAAIYVPEALRQKLAQPPAAVPAATMPVADTDDEARTPATSLTLVPLDEATKAKLFWQVGELEDLVRADEHLGGTPSPERLERRHRLRRELLERLRERDLTLVVTHFPKEHPQLVLIGDEAHVRFPAAARAINAALEAYRHDLVVARLDRAGLPETVLRPLAMETLELTPVAETLRTRLAGMIPLLLVILAASGAFFPALDLIAGERERGTLESLLSWPVARRDIFLGKLLVTGAAAALSVIINLASLAITLALAGSQLAAVGADLSGALSVGLGTLALGFLVLVPITATLAALSLALTGMAASAKEAQNYLTPLLLVVMVAASVSAIPDTRPSLVLDLVPITGAVLALKESLQGASLPWFHLALSTAASLALAAVVVGWATRLLESERFRYPSLVRAGWGRFRRWGPRPAAPGGLEVMMVYAVAVGGMILGGALLQNLGAPVLVAGPLLLFILLPALAHCWLGAYDPQRLFALARPAAGDLGRALAAVPCALLVSSAIFNLQPEMPPGANAGMDQVMSELGDGGLASVLICLALAPGVCEELFCRGTLLTGLRKSVGDTGGVILSAFLFAVLHLSPYRFLPQFVLGLALALLVLRSGSIIPAMLLHVGHNAAAVLIAIFSGWLLAHVPGAALVAALPPLAGLGLGLLGLWATVCFRGGLKGGSVPPLLRVGSGKSGENGDRRAPPDFPN